MTSGVYERKQSSKDKMSKTRLLKSYGVELPPGMKPCTKCKEMKPITAFYKRKNARVYPKCKPCRNQEIRDWRAENKDKIKEIIKRREVFYLKDPTARFKNSARVKLQAAVKKGEIKRGICHCGSENVHAHHPDYSKPLDVVWLCPLHHMEVHTKNKWNQ